ncbi:MAG: MBL fold metallo-hydrolase [Chloroflexota bacterium]
MPIKLTFLGAAQCVTGSQYLIEANGSRVLVDCGLYQERELKDRNWGAFSVPPKSLDAVLLTHAHLDHSGLLPRLVKDGFNRPLYSTGATNEITRIMLLDSANLLEEDAEKKRLRHQREGRNGPHPEIPLYTKEDAETVFPLFSPLKYDETVEIRKGIEAAFYDAGHVLGSSMVKVKINQNGETRTILFSGDIGRWDKPILCDPTLFDEADYVVMESTYGDRLIESSEAAGDELAEVINRTVKRGGNIVIPSFALERSQELLYYLNELLLKNRIPHLMVVVDSPMAISITEVFQNHPEICDPEMNLLLRQNKSPFSFPGLSLARTVDESKAINHISGSIIIIAGSGMCTGGRIKHHLVSNISRKESTILFVGYQAVGTLGRYIVDGAKEVRILGQNHRVKAEVVQLHGFSGHADMRELVKWVSGIKKPPKHIFITHGEPKASQHLASVISPSYGGKITIPSYKDGVWLE